jgi:hypothetical protein
MLTFLPGYVAFTGGLMRGVRRETATGGGTGNTGRVAMLVQQRGCTGGVQ